MEKCIVCNGPFQPNGNFNKQRQLTCTRKACQRALKTMRQHWQRSQKRKARKAKK